MRQRDRNKRRRVERQEEATARQATYDALSIAAKASRTSIRPGRSIREMARLKVEVHGEPEPIGGVRLA